MYNTKKITIGLFAFALLVGSNVVAKEKVKPKDMQSYAPAGKIMKSHKKLKPKHLYVKDEEQLKKEFYYRKHKEKEFEKMKKRNEQHRNQERIEKQHKLKNGDNNV